jgi:hypothetical protein
LTTFDSRDADVALRALGTFLLPAVAVIAGAALLSDQHLPDECEPATTDDPLEAAENHAADG